MEQALALPPGVALAIIAFLLSLLPASLFIWMWYLRRHDRAVPGKTIAIAFLGGMFLVLPAFKLEDLAQQAWLVISPTTAHYFSGAILPLEGPVDVLLPALGTFAVVAVVEEGLRYLFMFWWIKRSKVIDQIFDGLMIGVAVGLGFATLENSIYFLGLFQNGSYDTLVFVFFLRFIISTVAHVSFAGLMGTLLARGIFNVYNVRRYAIPAFFIPWFLHGLYDLLLGIDQSFYAVLLLLPALSVLLFWTGRRDFFVIHRKNGNLLAVEEIPTDIQGGLARAATAPVSPWNVPAAGQTTSAEAKFVGKSKHL
jgi:RsiW-degrading membrane proteinase PrsW (M82 family)